MNSNFDFNCNEFLKFKEGDSTRKSIKMSQSMSTEVKISKILYTCTHSTYKNREIFKPNGNLMGYNIGYVHG